MFGEGRDVGCYIMAQEGFRVIGNNQQDGTGEPIRVDATTRYALQRSGDTATNPISVGSDRSDHITVHNDTITIRGVVTNTPTLFSTKPSYGGSISSVENVNNYSEKYVKDINALMDNKTLITVFMSSVGVYSDCVITGFEPVRTKELGSGIGIKLTLKRIIPAAALERAQASDVASDLVEPSSRNGPTGGTGGTLPNNNGIIVLP